MIYTGSCEPSDLGRVGSKNQRQDLFGRLGGREIYLTVIRQKIEPKSLIVAQIERWRHALHMQVER